MNTLVMFLGVEYNVMFYNGKFLNTLHRPYEFSHTLDVFAERKVDIFNLEQIVVAAEVEFEPAVLSWFYQTQNCYLTEKEIDLLRHEKYKEFENKVKCGDRE